MGFAIRRNLEQFAGRDGGIGESALRRWVSQLVHERTGVTPQSKALTPEQQKNQELEARITRSSYYAHRLKRRSPGVERIRLRNCSPRAEALLASAVSCR